MDKDDWNSFYRFLNEANEEELRVKLEKARSVLAQVRTREVRSDVHRVIRLLEREMLIRQGLSSPASGRR